MSLFKKKPAARKYEPVPVDPFVGDEEARTLGAELSAGDWTRTQQTLEAADPTSRNALVERLSRFEGRPDWLDQWVAAKPESSIPSLFRGSHSVYWAWEARGSDRGHTVDADAAKVFFARLEAADQDLHRATEMDPADPTPWARMIPVAMGLQMDQDERRRRFNQVTSRDRWHSGAHLAMVSATAQKWSGSHEAMFELAWDALNNAPEGHDVHATMQSAQIERWLFFGFGDEDPKPLRRAYFKTPEVRDAVERASNRGVRSPQAAQTRQTVISRGYHAAALLLVDDWAAVNEQMELLGTAVANLPWAYFAGGAANAFGRIRASARANAG